MYSVRKLIHNKYNIYKSLVTNPYSKFFVVYIYQIFIFKKCQHTNFIIILTTTEDDILYKFTEEEWDRLCN